MKLSMATDCDTLTEFVFQDSICSVHTHSYIFVYENEIWYNGVAIYLDQEILDSIIAG